MTPRVHSYAQEAAQAHGVTVEAVLGRDRHPRVCDARNSVMSALYADGFSSLQIGRWLARDASTVRHALRGARG